MFDHSKYTSNRKTQKFKTETSTFATQIDSQNTYMYKTLGANMHPGEHFNYEKAMAFISLSTNMPRSYRQEIFPEQIKHVASSNRKRVWLITEKKTWKLAWCEPSMNALLSKYVFRMKSNEPKARLVVLALLQVHDVNYMETYALIVNIATFRILLALLAILDLELNQMDVVTAFLYEFLDEDIYM